MYAALNNPLPNCDRDVSLCERGESLEEGFPCSVCPLRDATLHRKRTPINSDLLFAWDWLGRRDKNLPTAPLTMEGEAIIEAVLLWQDLFRESIRARAEALQNRRREVAKSANVHRSNKAVE